MFLKIVIDQLEQFSTQYSAVNSYPQKKIFQNEIHRIANQKNP
jgi:hypothetical protein